MSEFPQADADYRCGFVAVVGRPNVGKSTLINHYIGRKVSIVSPRPQTTRHRILGVLTAPGSQVVFVDTPGLHQRAGKAMNRLMNRTAVSALNDADVVLWLLEAGVWTAADDNVLSHVARVSAPVIGVLNKTDQLRDKAELLPYIASIQAKRAFDEIVPVSALHGDQLDVLLAAIRKRLPESPPLFPEAMQTDRSVAFQYAEIVREKLTLRLRQELPYGLTVQTERISDEEDGTLTIHAVIFVERDSHKGIVVGKGGQQLKAVGTSARRDIERMTGRHVDLRLWVKVRENWADSEQDLARLGFDSPDG
jgi:GTP-binding protein Era